MRRTTWAAAFSLLGFVLVLLAVEAGFTGSLDRSIARHADATAYAHPGLVTFLKLVSAVFGPSTWRVAAVIGFLLLYRRSRTIAVWLAVTVILSGTLDDIVKAIVGRHRPHVLHPVVTLTDPSFPSGHALDSLVGVAALLVAASPYLTVVVLRWLIAVGVGLVLLVGYARVGLAVHYPTDVLAGWLLGGAWVAGTWILQRRLTQQP